MRNSHKKIALAIAVVILAGVSGALFSGARLGRFRDLSRSVDGVPDEEIAPGKPHFEKVVKSPSNPTLPVPQLMIENPKIPEPAGLAAAMGGKKSLVAIYNDEQRNPIWAPAMEEALKETFNAKTMESLGIPGTKLAESECRESTCRVTVRYSSDLQKSLKIQPIGKVKHPLDALTWEIGALGTANFTVNVADAQVDGQSYKDHSMIIAFDRKAIDPDRYTQTLVERGWKALRKMEGR